MTHLRFKKQEIIYIGLLLEIVCLASGTQYSANYGIKTKTYQHDPIITTNYEQEQQQQEPQRTLTYHRTTTVERLSPEQSTSTNNAGYNVGSYNSNNNNNDHQYQQTTNFQYQQQGNNNYNSHAQSQQQQQQHHQQETGAESQTTTTNTNWHDAENAITEYYTGCPAGHTGPLPYAYDCRRFINCWHGRGHIQSCAAGTVFNPETLECDRPNKVVCGTLSTLRQQDSHTTGNNAKYRSGRLSVGATENIDVLCPHGMSGLQPHPTDCTKFINCANGNVHVQQCGPGTAYDPSMMVCDFKEKVDCGTREYHHGEGLIDMRAFDSPSSALKLDKTKKVACPPAGAGLYPHPYDCTKFLNCANGITFIQDCGPGTAFDSENKVCDFKYKIKRCGNGAVTNTVTTWSETNVHDLNQGEVETVNENSSSAVDVLCPAEITGLFAHPFDYTKFLNCRNGNMVIQSCVAGKVFSISRGYCDSKEQVEYSDHVSYIVSELSYEYSKMLMSCPPETEGLHLYPYDCSKYIKCMSDGRLIILECKPNTVFSISRRTCLTKEQVQSNDRVKYFYELNSRETINNNQQASTVTAAITDYDSDHMVGCPISTTGFYPYPFDSLKYVNCRNGHLSIESCESGKAFSLSRKQCTPKEDLKPNDMVLYRREFAEEWSIEVNYGYGYTPGFAYLICPAQIEDGIFLHPFDCLKYIQCEHGKTTIKTCPMSKVFSISKQLCIERDRVEAYDRVEYYTDVQHEFSTDISKVSNQQTFTVCPPNAIGLYAYTSDPRKYLKCTADFQTFIESCSPGTYFSISKRYCDLEYRVAEVDRSSYGRIFEYETTHNFDDNNEFHVSCPPGANGMHPHPNDCTKFLNCANGVASVQSCGPGTAWSKEMEVCTMKDKIDCGGRTGGDLGSSTQYANTQTTVQTGSNAYGQHGRRNIVYTGSFGCPTDIQLGYYPHPFDSTRYISCLNGQSFIAMCNEGSVFSVSRRNCEIADRVSIQDRVIQMTEFLTEINLSQIRNDGSIACPAKGTGLHIYPFDCAKYVNCQEGLTTVEVCGEGSVFSMSHQMCLPQIQVKRIDRVSCADIGGHYAKPVSCPPGVSGMHAHPFDCTKFLNCSHGETNVQSCGPGTAWSKDMEVCDFKEKVDCTGRETYSGNGVQQSQFSTNNYNQFQNSQHGQQKIGCPTDIGEGFYPHPFDYNQYFICQRGQSLVSQCPRGNVFSISRRICDVSSKVNVTDHVEWLLDFVTEINMDVSQNLGYIQCPQRTVGVYVYPFDCTKFLKCDNGRTLIETCPSDSVFSLSNRMCILKVNVKTVDRVAFVTENQNDMYYRRNNEANMLVLCPMGVTGYFQHPFDWTKYLDCTNGQAFVKQCPAGSVFSISRGVCEFENNVSLDDRCSHGQTSKNENYDAGYSQNVIVSNSLDNGLAKCPTGANGMYPHPYDCAKYLNCANGVTYEESCGPGTVWNAVSKVCDFPDNVDCSKRRSQDFREAKNLNSVVKVSGVTVECPKGYDGFYPHPFDCTRFLNCESGVTHIQACGPGTAWNSAMEVCDFINNVDCSPKSRTNNHANRGARVYASSTTTNDLYGTHGSGSWSQTDAQQNYGGGGGVSSTTSYTDRWSNMNMARPDANAYRQNANTASSTAWTAGSYGQQGVYGQQNSHNKSIVSSYADSNWSAVGSSKDQRTPSENTLYMEGSLEPNRNYVNTINIYNKPSVPLAPFLPNVKTMTTTATTNTVYAQPVVDSEESHFDHVRGGNDRTTSFSTSNRQNHSRHINHMSTTNSWTPILQHEATLETHTAQLPNTQLMPPNQAPPVSQSATNRQNYNTPNTQLMPPTQSADDHQRPLDNDRIGQFEITNQDHIQSGSNINPVVSSLPTDASNLFGGLKPPPLSSSAAGRSQHNSYRPTTSMSQPTIRPHESNLYGGLQPPLSHTNIESIETHNISRTLQAPPEPTPPSNVRLHQIYPPMPNATSIKSHGNPHYSSPYAAVAHSRNTTWLTPRMDTVAFDSENHRPQNRTYANSYLAEATTNTERHIASLPPSFNRRYYQSSNNSSPATTDLADTNLPLSDALHMLLRPYFNRSGSANEETAHETESHIMHLVLDSKHSSTTSTSKPNIVQRYAPPTPRSPQSKKYDDRQQQQQSEEDVELILAGEQHSLIAVTSKNGTREVKTNFQTNQEKFNETKVTENWHNREFHLRHPNLPNPYNADAKRTDSNDAKYSPHNYGHHHLHHQHHHNRDFHLRHPEMPSPFTTTREGDRSIHSTDAFDIPNPYAESTTSIAPTFNLRSSVPDCQFDCGNGKCTQRFEICNGVDDCGNRKDEARCDHLGYQIRLTGGESAHMGRIEVKVLGKWGYVCDDKFGLLDADVVCRELGFKLGASEVRGNSFYPPLEVNFAFSMDEVECHGNETTLKDCNFKGWGIHNCGPDEVVGVVCKVPLFKCPNNYWLCSTSKECIPPDFVCDHTPDCADKSDESEQVCNSPIEFRLEGGRNKNEGRLEVKYRGEWGTVCDDDFGVREAQVACNSLGYYGKPTVEKNIYGPGSGPIWLDQVACLGNETSIDKCNHWNWGEQNCNHTEDVGIRCTAGPPPRHLIKNNRRNDEDVQHQQQTQLDDVMDLYHDTLERSSKFLRVQPNCGHFKSNLFDEYAHSEQERVVNGTIAKRGRHPWQATIRTRGRGGISSHWCGAVLIGDGNAKYSSYLLTAAHCLAGYQKGAYFVRMGDHYANIAESSEVDAYIENWYVHEKFRDQTHMNNDIALVVLKSPVHFNDYIQPICLPEKGNALQTGRECTISGWGSIKSGVSTPSNILRAAKVPILSDATCRQSHVYGTSMTEGMFCAGSMDESVDACDGDSGGPLVCDNDGADTLYGIISWGQHCGYANKPGVYVRIEKYIDWIYEKINFSLQQNGKMN